MGYVDKLSETPKYQTSRKFIQNVSSCFMHTDRENEREADGQIHFSRHSTGFPTHLKRK